MAEYANTFGGAAQDLANATILGAEWDTEYANIDTVIATKQDKIVTPTLGNLIELSAGGVPTDATSDSDNLDGLTGVVETRMAAIESAHAALQPPSTVSGWIKAGPFLFPDGSQSNTQFSWPSAALNTWKSVGDSGNGGTDYTWTVLDDLASQKVTMILVGLIITNEDTTISRHNTECFMGRASDTIQHTTWSGKGHLESSADSQSLDATMLQPTWVPVDFSDGIEFQVRYEKDSLGASSIYMNLMGVIRELA